jgi:hypothetical protein
MSLFHYAEEHASRQAAATIRSTVETDAVRPLLDSVLIPLAGTDWTHWSDLSARLVEWIARAALTPPTHDLGVIFPEVHLTGRLRPIFLSRFDVAVDWVNDGRFDNVLNDIDGDRFEAFCPTFRLPDSAPVYWTEHVDTLLTYLAKAPLARAQDALVQV